MTATSAQRNVTLLICDLDNTLYDWVSYFVPSFYAMVDKVVELLECDQNGQEQLLDDLRKVHQKYNDLEHPFSLLEARKIREMFPNLSRKELADKLDPAFYAFNVTRKKTLRLYPNVFETLKRLGQNDITLVAHTESRLHAALDRMNRLNLTQFFTRIYCREAAPTRHPSSERQKTIRRSYPSEKIRELSEHQRKPDKTVLNEICGNEGFNIGNVAYIGDSKVRDVLMARNAGVFSIWAEYGSKHDPLDWDKLVRISPWSDEDKEREKRLNGATKAIMPDFIAEHSFAQVLEALGLAPTPADFIEVRA